MKTDEPQRPEAHKEKADSRSPQSAGYVMRKDPRGISAYVGITPTEAVEIARSLGDAVYFFGGKNNNYVFKAYPDNYYVST